VFFQLQQAAVKISKKISPHYANPPVSLGLRNRRKETGNCSPVRKLIIHKMRNGRNKGFVVVFWDTVCMYYDVENSSVFFNLEGIFQ